MAPNPDDPLGPARQGHWATISAEDRFSRVVDASPTALVLTGPSGLIEMVNRQAERMFGYDRQELISRPLEVLMPERFRSDHASLRDHFLAHRAARLMGEGRELFGVRKDGLEFPLEIGLNPVDLDGQPMVLAGIIDVTARRRLELEKDQQRLELERANADLARSNSDLEEFAYVASHDLKAPLRAISHLTEWIAEEVEVTASTDTIDNLKMLRGRVVRLQALLDGLLAYSRVGRTSASIEEVDVAEVVGDVITVLSPPPGFEIKCADDMPRLRTHRSAILAVLQNLISNGLKHHDRSEGHITISMVLKHGIAEFHVSDDGPGIPPRFHQRIFVIFQTLTSRDELEASGIGLAIVKKRVESHGGQIRVESVPPIRGTTFVFTWNETTE